MTPEMQRKIQAIDDHEIENGKPDDKIQNPDLIKGFPIIQIGAVPDLGPVRWLVESLWLDQGCGVIGGHPKSGKSWLVEYLMICVASGKPAFGKFAVDQGRTLLFNAEDRPGRTKERIRAMCRAMDLDLGTLDFHLIDVPRFRLDDAKQVEQFRLTVERVRPKWVALDPLRNLHELDEDKASQMAPLLVPLRLLQRQFECSVTLVHHYTKDPNGGSSGRSAGQKLRGSSVFHGWLDSGLYVTAKGEMWNDPRAVIVEQRDGETIHPFGFHLDKTIMREGEAIWLQYLDGKEDDAADRAASMQADENQVIGILQAAKEPLSFEAIRCVAKRKNGWASAPTRRLIEAGTVVPVSAKGGHPTYWLKSRDLP